MLAEVRSYMDISLDLLDGPFGQAIMDNGRADRHTIEDLKESIRLWGGHPEAFFTNIHVEVMGCKPG